ncbi:hypothetical protein [Sphingomonas beigongshangi]|uniref:hypothetical protein n=1 Tax=Sphingomonas beigongshangi TaxID=2782540 RepID=UPI00193BB2F8|nr:hypothetical protein [Sphingomonas beigongshangi]
MLNRRNILGGAAALPVIAVAACAATPAAAASRSPFEALRLEYIAVQTRGNAGWEDDHPEFLAICDRLTQIERAMIHQPCQSLADAQAKMRFMMVLNDFGSVFDGDDSHAIVADMSRFMLEDAA